jgi:hypothetical protein
MRWRGCLDRFLPKDFFGSVPLDAKITKITRTAQSP